MPSRMKVRGKLFPFHRIQTDVPLGYGWKPYMYTEFAMVSSTIGMGIILGIASGYFLWNNYHYRPSGFEWQTGHLYETGIEEERKMDLHDIGDVVEYIYDDGTSEFASWYRSDVLYTPGEGVQSVPKGIFSNDMVGDKKGSVYKTPATSDAL